MKTYYSLLSKQDGRWAIEFGSYVRSEVAFEKREMVGGGFTRRDLKIIQTDDTQVDIYAAVALLNMKENLRGHVDSAD